LAVALPGTGEQAAVIVERLMPELRAQLTVELEMDHAPAGPGPGDALRYVLRLANQGEGTAFGVVVDLPVPAHTTLVAGPNTLAGLSSSPIRSGLADRTRLRRFALTVDALAPASIQELELLVAIDDPLPAGVSEIVNQATVVADELAQVPSDDPERPGVADPTVLLLSQVIDIPTMGWLALLLLGLGLGWFAVVRLRGGV
jgi:uncharacterized repeat protein (TIGR01451 family)